MESKFNARKISLFVFKSEIFKKVNSIKSY